MSAENFSFDEAMASQLTVDTQPKSIAFQDSESKEVKSKSTQLLENVDRFVIQRRFIGGEGKV